jgi:N-acetyl-anhydromuramyl-L-alanine amidase AmpD
MIENPKIKQYAIHHTAVSRTQNGVQLFAVDRYHKNNSPYNYLGHPSTNGWWVAYNYFIDVDGTVTYTRAVGEETIANRGHNCDIRERCDTISVCIAGDFNRELMTDAQIVSLGKLVDKLEAEYPDIKHTFHRSIQTGRTCPGTLFTEQYLTQRVLKKDIRESANDEEKRKAQIAQIQSLMDTIRALLRKLYGTKVV